MKTSKFLIAENPMVNDHRTFIVHTREPFFMAEAFHFSEDQESGWMECKRQFNLGATVDYPDELIALGVIYMEPTNLNADELAKIMSRMGDWYYSYLKWEDS